MLIENFSERKNELKIKDYFDSFFNFLGKTPILFSKVEKIGDTLYIHLPDDPENPIVFQVYLEQDKHSQIRVLKELLYESYPVISYPEEHELKLSKRVELERAGVPLDNILTQKEIIFKPKYRIIRAHTKFNEIDVEEISSGKVFKCKVYVPIVTLLNNLQKLDEESSYKLYSDKVKIKFEMIKKEKSE